MELKALVSSRLEKTMCLMPTCKRGRKVQVLGKQAAGRNVFTSLQATELSALVADMQCRASTGVTSC